MIIGTLDPIQNLVGSIAQMCLDEYMFYPDYKYRPVDFAKDILGVEWTPEIQLIARDLLMEPRIVVPAGHGVGKTHGVAGIVLWWISTRQTIAVTTAPTWRQVTDLIWRELRRQHRGGYKALPGAPITSKWDMQEDWYAIGVSTNRADNLQGYHSDELLIVMDEACGIEKWVWETVEDGLAVTEGNRILAIGNPTDPAGRFAQVARSPDWKCHTMSCLTHPNIIEGKQVIKRAVSKQWVERRVEKWCIPYQDIPDQEKSADVFEFDGAFYIPNDMFRIRVLGQFPIAGGSQIIPLHHIRRAFERDPKNPEGSKHMGFDVARYGDDLSVLVTGSDNGVILDIDAWQGLNTVESSGRIKYWVGQHQPIENIAVDDIGVGGGVTDNLAEANYPVLPVNVSRAAYDTEMYPLLRDELTYEMAQAFADGEVDLTRISNWEEQITEELNALSFSYTAKGQRKVVSKDKIKEKIGHSPNFSDSLMLFFAYREKDYIAGAVPKKKEESWDDF